MILGGGRIECRAWFGTNITVGLAKSVNAVTGESEPTAPQGNGLLQIGRHTAQEISQLRL